mmetsp:Transcript_57654/g.172013  ORF Transcript_57654/g.172013 Transcript_57654/m.172013 type:complete len:88 (-) Transcript_57654:693-956(-)
MDKSKQDPSKEPEIAVHATPVGSGAAGAGVGGGPGGGSPIPTGHSRYYCEKCHAPYDLPDRATSWRCSNCSTFNSITPGECEWCSIL